MTEPDYDYILCNINKDNSNDSNSNFQVFSQFMLALLNT